jgi:hypothetical protein
LYNAGYAWRSSAVKVKLRYVPTLASRLGLPVDTKIEYPAQLPRPQAFLEQPISENALKYVEHIRNDLSAFTNAKLKIILFDVLYSLDLEDTPLWEVHSTVAQWNTWKYVVDQAIETRKHLKAHVNPSLI